MAYTISYIGFSPYPIRANYSERVGRKVTGLMSLEEAMAAGPPKKLGRNEGPSFWMGFFHPNSGRLKMEKIICMKCGERLGYISEIRLAIVSDPKHELLAQCGCGEKYSIRLSSYGAILTVGSGCISLY